MESLTQPPIGEISKAFLEMVWKYLLLLIILQKNSFWEIAKDSDVSPDCLQMRHVWLSPVVSMKNKKPEKTSVLCLGYTGGIFVKAVYCKL